MAATLGDAVRAACAEVTHGLAPPDAAVMSAFAISYCYGRSSTDSYPTAHTAIDFEVFADQILSLPRARCRESRTYICGPMRPNGDGRTHRGKADLMPRGWLALDLDGGSREGCDLMLLRLTDYMAVAWTTARSTPECPRIRILVALDRLVDGPEGERLGSAFVGVVGAGLDSLRWDKSTHKGEQECFLPMADAEIMRYHGDPVDVDAVLATVPVEPNLERPTTVDPYRALIIERGLLLREMVTTRRAAARATIPAYVIRVTHVIRKHKHYNRSLRLPPRVRQVFYLLMFHKH